MRLYIPAPTDVLVLERNWTFQVFTDLINQDIGKTLGFLSPSPDDFGRFLWKVQGKNRSIPNPHLEHIVAGTCSLPPETKLEIIKIDVRAVKTRRFHTVTFRITECTFGEMQGLFFRALLEDVNRMHIRRAR